MSMSASKTLFDRLSGGCTASRVLRFAMVCRPRANAPAIDTAEAVIRTTNFYRPRSAYNGQACAMMNKRFPHRRASGAPMKWTVEKLISDLRG